MRVFGHERPLLRRTRNIVTANFQRSRLAVTSTAVGAAEPQYALL